jgi:hypothetical protein
MHLLQPRQLHAGCVVASRACIPAQPDRRSPEEQERAITKSAPVPMIGRQRLTTRSCARFSFRLSCHESVPLPVHP